MKKELKTNSAPKAIGPYSQGIIANNLLFVSGQIPINPENSEIPNNIKDQTQQVLSNLMAILKEGNTTAENVVKCTIFIKNMDHFSIINEIYQTFFNAPFPARSVVEVSKLPKDVLIEIEAIALVNK